MADFIADLLSKIKTRSSVTIGVSISQSGLLEVCQYDSISHTVSAYANRTIKYNQQNREVEDIDEFQANLLSIYQELNIPNNCSAVLSLPNVYFDLTSVPLILDNFAIENVLLGEVEQSYIFKKNEPVVSWVELGQNERNENRTIAYSAIQRSEMELFVRTFNNIGTKLLAIDNAYFNMVNAICHTQIAKKEIDNQDPWNIVLINNNSFIICSMVGSKFTEYYEEPIALRSINSQEERYSTLSESINASIKNYVANSILLISDSDDIDASELCNQINFHGQKNYLNQNKFASGQIIETTPNVLFSYISSISLYALGAAIYPTLEDYKKLNLMGAVQIDSPVSAYGITLGGIEITKDIIQIATILIVIIIAAFYGTIFLVLSANNKSLEAKMAEIDNQNVAATQQLKEIEEQLGMGDEKKEKPFDLLSAKEEIIENNKKEIIYYNLLSFNIPRSTWLTHFYTDSKGAVSIEGRTSSTNNVYLFFKGIKSSVEDSDLALTKLKYSTGFEDEIPFTNRLLYDFELSNAAYATSEKASAVPTPPSASELTEALNQAKEDTQSKVSKDNKKSNTEKTPDLPPIEDIKTPSKDNGAKKSSNNNERLTKEDVDNVKKSREAKNNTNTQNTSSKNNNASLPDLPDLED